jgi:hypothetical protein
MGPQSCGRIHAGRGRIYIVVAQKRQRDSDATGSKDTDSVGQRIAEQGRQVMHMAAEAYELLTPDTWMLEDCDEYMTELDEELKRLKDLFKQFSTDRLNLAMRREAAKLINNVNTEVTKARKIVQRLIAIHEAGVTSDEEQEEETSRPEMGAVDGSVDASDGSGMYVRLPQEAQTPRPRRSRSGKENDGEAVPMTQLPPRISSGLTVCISGLQTGAAFPVDASTSQEGESRSLPIIYLDDVSNTGRSPPRNAREDGRNGAEEDVRFGDDWDLPTGAGTRTWTKPGPPQSHAGGGPADPRQDNRGSDGHTRSPADTRSSSETRP